MIKKQPINLMIISHPLEQLWLDNDLKNGNDRYSDDNDCNLKSSGLDVFNVGLLKLAAPIICTSLAYFVTLFVISVYFCIHV